jgi:F420-non-reducing hydrogenase small subunit
MTVKVASDWLNSCSGCEISIVDMGERLLDVLKVAQFVHLPALMDHKYFGQMGDGKHISIPEADVGILSGGLRNQEHVEVAEAFRKSCNVIIALGTCATHGGIPTLANSFTNQEIKQRYYSTETTDAPEAFPDQGLPKLLDRCMALDECIPVDIYMPGCPPHPDHIFSALVALVEGRPAVLPEKSVCDTCPTRREGKGQIKTLRRFLEAPEYGAAGEPLDQMRCLLEQGFHVHGTCDAGRLRRRRHFAPLCLGARTLPRVLRTCAAQWQPAPGHAQCAGIQRHRCDRAARKYFDAALFRCPWPLAPGVPVTHMLPSTDP